MRGLRLLSNNVADRLRFSTRYCMMMTRIRKQAPKGSSRSGAQKPIPFLTLCWVAFAYLSVACSGAELCSAQPKTGPTCDPQTVFRLADAKLKRQQYDRAERELDRLFGCSGLPSIDRFNLGWLYGRARNFKKALSEFNSVGEDVPNPRTHQYAIALAEFELADYNAAVETLRKTETKDLDQESANLLAVSYSKLGRYGESYVILTDEIHRHPDDRLGYLNLITLLCDQGRLEDAVEVANETVATFPRNAEVLVVRGATETLVGNTAGAQADFKAAIKASPLYGPPRFLLAISEYKEGNFEAACDEITQAIRSGVKDADLHYLLAETLLRLDPGNTDNVLAELNRAIAMNSRHVQALSLRGKLRLQQHDLKSAVSDLELAHSIDPASASAAYNLARAYFALGKTKEAEDISRQLASTGVDAVNELSDQKVKSALGMQGRERGK